MGPASRGSSRAFSLGRIALNAGGGVPAMADRRRVPEERQRMSDPAAFLAKHGVRPSYPRLKILEYLAGTKEHPSAEMIHRDLVLSLPTLSRTTVYNTLRLFAAVGIARELRIDETEARFDADMRPHGHFRCRACGRVFDFPLTPGIEQPALPEGFKLERAELSCEGLCPACATSSLPLP